MICEGGYFLVLMRLRTGASNLDIGERHIRWSCRKTDINLDQLFVHNFGELEDMATSRCFATEEFKLKYPNNIGIIDATELKV